MRTISADQLLVGDVIDFRGHPARVIAAWNDQRNSPIRKAPIGCEIEWVDNDSPDPETHQPNRTRLVWPDLTADERRSLTPAEIAALLAADLAARPLTVI
jgi:hypothetical protein